MGAQQPSQSGGGAGGGLTDAQLRAAAVPMSLADGVDANAGSTTDAAVITDSNGTLSAKIRGLVKLLASVISGGKVLVTTDPITGSVTVSNFPADQLVHATNLDVALSTRTKPADQQHVIVDSSASIAVTGPLTDAQLRASAVPISGNVGVIGNVEVVNDVGNPLPVSGTVTANAGTNLNTSALALDSTVAKDASLTTIDTDIKATQPRSITSIVPGVGATNLGKAEDAASADGDVGVASLGVRQPIPVTTTNAVGDYAFLSMDDQGRLWINSDVLMAQMQRSNELLQQLLVEMRINNFYLPAGLNVPTDADQLRSDPYFSN